MRTVTGLFDSYGDASRAINELEALGVSPDDISIVSKNGTADHPAGESLAAEGAGTGAGIGALAGGTGGLLAGLGMMAIPGIGPVVVTMAGAALMKTHRLTPPTSSSWRGCDEASDN